MVVTQIDGLSHLLHINQANFFPMFHLRVLGYCLLNVSLHKKSLINWAHALNYFFNIKRGSEGNEPFHFWSFMILWKISYQIVSSEACSENINCRIWILFFNLIQSSIELFKRSSRKWHWTGHFCIDPPTIQTNKLVTSLHSLNSQSFDIIGIASPS